MRMTCPSVRGDKVEGTRRAFHIVWKLHKRTAQLITPGREKEASGMRMMMTQDMRQAGQSMCGGMHAEKCFPHPPGFL